MGLFLRRNIAWVGDTPMVEAMANLLSSGPITVDLVFHRVLDIRKFNNRKDLTLFCEEQILQGLNKKIKI